LAQFPHGCFQFPAHGCTARLFSSLKFGSVALKQIRERGHAHEGFIDF
jgi:hypothetical protein